MPTEQQWGAARARLAMYGALREFFRERGYLEVETPCLVPAPGMEPHIDPFEVTYAAQMEGRTRRSLFLHTSPEYAMKRLLAEKSLPLFQICKTFRNGEISRTHNPEFTLLEFYRPHADYHVIMDELEGALAAVERAVATCGDSTSRSPSASTVPGAPVFDTHPWERLTVQEAVLRHTGIDIFAQPDAASFRRVVMEAGVHVGESTTFDDVFFHLFLERVEPNLGMGRPTLLLEYPASMASLARVKPSDSRVAERVELYARGLELANGYSELTDAVEQRVRLVEEQEFRRERGKTVLPIDETFLEAVAKMPPAGGIAVGLDRVLMLLLGCREIRDVLLFPAHEFGGLTTLS
jgi:lysyl-tRNA synthetase class 2